MVANLFSLVAFRAASLRSSGNFIPHSVNNKPGLIELTLMLGAAMTARDLLRWIAAALVTIYGKEDPLVRTPAKLAVVMKTPWLFSSSAFAAWNSQR